MIHRPRRLRRTAGLRALTAETHVPARSLVQPHFVLPDDRAEQPLDSMPGIARMGVERLVPQVAADLELGVRSVLLFGVPAAKDPEGRAGEDPDGPVQRAAAALRREFEDEVTVIADVCLCTYTDHGHCGLVVDGEVANDPGLERLAAQAVSLADAGAHVVAPSDMMDGRVAAIRTALDARQHTGTAILSYAVKYASSFYGPFRDAAESAPGPGADVPEDRRTYQMDVRNSREALREARLDEEEGADILMVKPALAFLDVLARVRAATDLPLAAYLVSGEYAAIELMAREGLARKPDLVREHLGAVRRAGADILMTYHARQALENHWL